MTDFPDSAVILAGGDPIPADVMEDIPEGAFVIAADSGLDQARSIGLPVDLLVGDLDSVSPEALAAASEVPVERYPADKDATDLELALLAALRLEVDRVVIVGGHGGRLDHLLANALLIASERFSAMSIEWLAGAARVHVVRGESQLHAAVGETVTLLAVGGPASGVSTWGLRWELADQTLYPGSTRGVSNEFLQPVGRVTVRAGTLLAVIPQHLQGMQPPAAAEPPPPSTSM